MLIWAEYSNFGVISFLFQSFSSFHQLSSVSVSSLDSLLGLCLEQYIEPSYLIALQPLAEQILLIETYLVSVDLPVSLPSQSMGATQNQHNMSNINWPSIQSPLRILSVIHFHVPPVFFFLSFWF